ncbi:HET-domain-containing protein [Lentinus brumalis]|uniref:HET-domain-containing protein n=1 Tax=Lentinus brumalis TaxID=2498619 RepID=A0A371CMB1_9APHY|nr:HET-domain-containing protein [Polyporus brumalis]
MRLVNTKTYVMQNFLEDDELPPYAILSHVWVKGDVEVTFADMQDLKVAQRRKQWPKVEHFCTLARENGLEWAWDDTFCIDKSDSAELSRALNSMYAWYGGARVCYAYLRDVEDPGEEDPALEDSSFRGSSWFRRGWTLQELIAPKVVLFYSKSWRPLGSKLSLAVAIGEITNIDATVLMQTRLVDDVSIARRMSWAAARETTVVEDRAYSLMGIFGVNMPTIYGEGSRAFIRLQLEIIRTSTDQSIFAWGKPYGIQEFVDNASAFTDLPSWATEFRCLLASSPDRFKGSANIVPFPVEDFSTYTHPNCFCDIPEYTPTNYGIQIHLPLYMLTDTPFATGLALLACKDATTGEIVSLFVRRREPSANRFYVGAYTPRTGPMPQSEWHPRLRMFLMQPQGHILCSRILQNVKIARMYLHSYNVHPQRSISQGFASGDLILHGPPSTSDGRESRIVSFVIFGSLLKQLAKMGLHVVGYGEARPTLAGWTPRHLWRQETGVGLKLTLQRPPAPLANESGHPSAPAAILFRRAHPNAPHIAGTAFGLLFGFTEVGSVWATAAIVMRDSPVDERSDSHAGHWLVRGLLPSFTDITVQTAKEEGYDVAGWENDTHEVRAGTSLGQRVVRLSLTRWLPHEEPGVLDRDSVMTYTVALQFDLGPGLRLWAMSEEEKMESLGSLSDIVLQ